MARARVCARFFVVVVRGFFGVWFCMFGYWMFPGFWGYFCDSTTYYMREEAYLWLVGRVLM